LLLDALFERRSWCVARGLFHDADVAIGDACVPQKVATD
jgi:hypothetical protein